MTNQKQEQSPLEAIPPDELIDAYRWGRRINMRACQALAFARRSLVVGGEAALGDALRVKP